MKCSKIALAVTVVAMTTLVPGAATATDGETLVVDDDGQQCGAEAYPTVAAALNHAVDGDAIVVCPGRYSGGIHVSKSVSILGPLRDTTGPECESTATRPEDLTQVAVIQPLMDTDEATEPLLTLAADGVELAGLVLRGVTDLNPAKLDGFDIYTPALRTDGHYAGYRIHDNLIHGNTLGLELGSSGTTPSRVDHNCLRGNSWGLANQRENLMNAVIDTNTTSQTARLAYEIGWGLVGTSHVTLQDNTSAEDSTTLFLENSDSTRVLDNTVTKPITRGFQIMGGNEDIELIDNVLTGNPTSTMAVTGMSLFTPSARIPARSTGVVIASNTIADMRTTTGTGLGIAIQAGAATGVELYDNALIRNGTAGLMIQNDNTDNVVQDNVIRDNVGLGIRIQGTSSTGNQFVDNVVLDNGTDVRDDTDPVSIDGVILLSTWIDTRCRSDLPVGAICGVD